MLDIFIIAPRWGCCTNIILRYRTVSWIVFADRSMYVHMCFQKKNLVVQNNLVIYFWIEMALSWPLNFYSFFSASIWKWHALVMYSIYGIKESNISWENYCYTIWYVKRNNCVVKTLCIVCLLLPRGMTTLWRP